jgi:hypothetical protein
MESKLKNSYDTRVDLIKDLNAVNLESFKEEFNAFMSELLSIDTMQDFSKKTTKLKNDAIFDNIAKKVLPSNQEYQGVTINDPIVQENKKLKEKLVYIAADNFVKKN